MSSEVRDCTMQECAVRELLAGCQAAERDPLLRAILVHHNSGGDPELVRAAMLDVLDDYDVGLGTLQEMEADPHKAEGQGPAAGQKKTEKDASVHVDEVSSGST